MIQTSEPRGAAQFEPHQLNLTDWLSSRLVSSRSAGLAGGRGLVLVLCDLRQQDRVSLAAGEEDRPPAAGLNPGTPADTGERFCTDTRGRRFQ